MTTGSASMSTSSSTPRELITHYHTLQKQLASLPYNTSFPTAAARQAQANLLRAQLSQISLPNYQQASLQGESQKTFDVTTWVLSNLPSGHRILDVGSIIHRFPDVYNGRQLLVTSIDLHSEDERVTNIDFFDFVSDDRFDAVVLSLCVNFVGCPRRRGAMIRKAAGLLKEHAWLFLVLPAACVKNSRYCDEQVLKNVLTVCGLQPVSLSYDGKLCLTIARRLGEAEGSTLVEDVKRRLVRSGRQRNNFAIVVDSDDRSNDARDIVTPRTGTDEEKRKGKKKGKANKKTAGAKPVGRSPGITKTTSNQRRRARRQAKRGQKQSTSAG